MINNKKIVAIIQARLTSTRFPRKVLEKIDGKSMISRVCKAAREAKLVDHVSVAWAHKFPYFNENDVLNRFRAVAIEQYASVVVRITSDCPLLEGWMIDRAIGRYFERGELYYCNCDEGVLDGFDVQVFDANVLWNDAYTDKEHVIKPRPKYSVDTREDLERVRKLCETK